VIAHTWDRWRTRLGVALLAVFAGVALLAPVVAPNDPNTQFQDKAYAPPMRVRLSDGAGFHAPFVNPQVLEDRLARRYRDDETARLTLKWFSGGKIASLGADQGPLLLLGADPLGRDLFARLVHGARLSFALAALGVMGALILGAVIGGFAGSSGGAAESGLMLITDFFLVLPGAYLVLVLRGALPLVLSTTQVFFLMAIFFSIAAWPHAARGVRAIVATERQREYAMAARAAGAGRLRLMRHLLPAARGFLTVEVLLLIPALLVAEATVSYLGLGFPVPTASLGTMLQDAAKVSLMREAPWLLAPAATLFAVVLAVQLVVWTSAPATDLFVGRRRTP
jgi:peptide/nickel transport system permease protein